jgi:17beta-estradiol 17-dehydrogenase / very-long-chain 3-oxoacyl-CoA reductase
VDHTRLISATRSFISAVIVGATSEIGQAYAEELARRNMNVVLISKSYDDLVLLVAKIQSEYSVQAYGIHADFMLGRHVYQEIYDALQELEIGILVNVAAVQYDHPQYFVLIPLLRLLQILDENISAATVMTYQLLPQMLERQRGAVINVCSQISCLPPTPLLSAYTASMVYLRSLSECLQLESRRRGVIVQTLLPGFVASSTCRPTFFTPSPATYVRHALATLGVASITCGYWPHSIQSWLTSCLPQWLWVCVVSLLFRRHRLQSITLAKEQGMEQFTRRRKMSMPVGPLALPTSRRPATVTAPPAALRRVSGNLGVTLRRSPSPQRKISGGTPTNFQGGTPLRPMDSLFHRTGANVPSPIPESPLSPRFFFQGGSHDMPPSTSTPLGPNIGPPKPSLSAATRPETVRQRPRPSIVYSKVTVMPSLVRYSQQAEDEPLSLPTSNGGPQNVTDTSDKQTASQDEEQDVEREDDDEEKEEKDVTADDTHNNKTS